jgi:hypothetical protein
MTGVKSINEKTTFAAFAVLTVILLAPAAVRAQWTTPDASGNTGTASGVTNVGVGTGASSPAAKLDVRGNIALDGTVPAAHAATNYSSLWLKNNVSFISEVASGYSVLTLGTNYQRSGGVWSNVSQSMPTWSLSFGGGAGYDLFELNHSPSGPYVRSTFLVVNSSGNVGVGTKTPANALHVHNASGAQGIRVSGSGSALVNFMDTSAGANQKLYQWRSEGGLFRMSLANDSELSFAQQNILVANPSGNVGIGTAAPTSKLHIGAGTSQTNIAIDGSAGASYNGLILNTAGTQKWYMGRNGADGTDDFILRANSSANVIRAFSPGAVADTLVLNSGNVGIGTTNLTHTLEVAGTINASGGITGATISATYQDVAEWVPSTQKLAAGTVVVLDTGKTNHVLASTIAYDTKVAGVISDSPGVILGQSGDDKLKVATTGRVKVKVDATRAPIKVGDLLVTSDVEGVAMKSVEVDLGGVKIHRPGTIIGKALEPLNKGVGEILVLLSLQ